MKGTIVQIDELKSLPNNTSRDQFINARWEFREKVQEYIVQIGENLKELQRARPELLEARKEVVNWSKVQKLERALKAGYWAELYQLAWRFVSRDSDAIKTILGEFLTLKN